ncbi:hypothetical protein GEMRC1_007399 [Eukaryota sp. GEM-RC1]
MTNFNSFISLSGTSLFHFEAGSEDVNLHVIELFDQSKLIMDRYSSVEHFTFYGGYLEGASIIMFPNHFNFTSSAYKELSAPIVNDGFMYFDRSFGTISVHFKGSGSISNAGDLIAFSNTILRYSSAHNHNGQEQPFLSNQGDLIVENSGDLSIEIPFTNAETVLVNSGSLKFSNPTQLMGNFNVTDTLIVDSDAEFGRGVLLTGNGTLVISRNRKVDFDGNYVFEGGLDVRNGASFNFLSYSTTRFFNPKFAECGATVTWIFDSTLSLRDFILKDSCNSFIIKAGAVWTPMTHFNSFISLSGTSLFHFGSR